MTKPLMMVVAGALQRSDGRWLMQCRPPGKHHAGLWEFPGGKVEDGEPPVTALCRELSEECGITVAQSQCHPVTFAENAHHDDDRGIVILLYIVRGWQGEPQSLEGGTLGWFHASEALALSKPPLDVDLAARLFQKN